MDGVWFLRLSARLQHYTTYLFNLPPLADRLAVGKSSLRALLLHVFEIPVNSPTSAGGGWAILQSPELESRVDSVTFRRRAERSFDQFFLFLSAPFLLSWVASIILLFEFSLITLVFEAFVHAAYASRVYSAADALLGLCLSAALSIQDIHDYENLSHSFFLTTVCLVVQFRTWFYVLT